MTDFLRLERPSTRGGPPGRRSEPGLLVRLTGMLAAGVVLTAAFVASAVLLVVLLAVGCAAVAWFWWKTRALRKALREQRDAPLGAEYRHESHLRPDLSGQRRPHRTDDVSDATILREDALEARAPGAPRGP